MTIVDEDLVFGKVYYTDKDYYFVAWTGPCGLTFWKCSRKSFFEKDNFEKNAFKLTLYKICNLYKKK